VDIVVYFSRFGTLYQEKSGNPGFKVLNWFSPEKFFYCSGLHLEFQTDSLITEKLTIKVGTTVCKQGDQMSL
jgi:hypothetical protein